MPNYNSLYKRYANSILEWLPMDTYELYVKNLSSRYNELKKFDWIDKTFTYQFNSHGFRCDEFSHNDSIMFLGCSHTCGIGLPVHETWASTVAETLGLHNSNLGVGGSSLDTAFRLCHGYIDLIKPKVVVLMRPPGIRFELVSNHEVMNINPSMPISLYESWSIDENNNYFNCERNILAIKMMCADRHIKLTVIDWTELQRTDSLARDLAHFGTKSHKSAAYKILNLI